MTWQPIETYDALPQRKRPKFAAFYYPAEMAGRTQLSKTVQFERNFGRRTCTHWTPLPEPPEQTVTP
jgi:hypothetical protein